MVILYLIVALMLSFLWTASPIFSVLPFQFLPLLAFLRHRHKDGPWVAAAAGLLTDLALGLPLGTFGLSLSLSSFLFREAFRSFLLTPRVTLVLLFLYLLAKDLIAMGVLAFFSMRWSPSFLAYLLTLLAYYPVYKKNERALRKA